jgi:hypothetical protein
MHQMDDETFGALRVILDDYNRDDPAGTYRGESSQIEDLERLDRAYKIVGEWYWKRALTLP